MIVPELVLLFVVIVVAILSARGIGRFSDSYTSARKNWFGFAKPKETETEALRKEVKELRKLLAGEETKPEKPALPKPPGKFWS
jgi:hypothetical protein